MLSIDGLVTGLDTTGIIDGLLQIQQRQIDTLSARRAENIGKQSAFSGLEARLVAFQGALGRLTSIQTTALQDKVVSSSDEDVIQAAASDDAAVGTYRMSVEQLATSHQIATAGYATAESTVGEGEHTIQVGSDGAEYRFTIDESNNTLEGVAAAINDSGADVTATIINEGSGDTPYRLLLTSNDTGEENTISVTNNSGEPLVFDRTVQEAENAKVQIGSGDGAIVIENQSNRLDNVIAGVTLNLQRADAGKEVTLNVATDTEGGVEAVQNFVSAYNDFIDYVNTQVQYDPESNLGGPLVGERSVVEIKDELSLALSSVVGGLTSDVNRMNSVGLSLKDDGKLSLDEGELRDVLSGGVDDVTAKDVAELFALSGNTSSDDFEFILGNRSTVEGEFSINITQIAEAASIQSSSAASGTITIDESNDTFSLLVDGTSSGDLTLTHGDYTVDELAAHLQSTINASSELVNRSVSVENDGGVISITSDTIGSNSEVTLQTGSVFSQLGFVGDETDSGQDVAGNFIVDGVIEEATGRGSVLEGNKDNANTADLQIRVNLGADDIIDGAEGSVTVTRGLASRLDQIIERIVGVEGDLEVIDDRFEETNEGIQETIDRLQARFEAQQQTLIAEFAALEGAVGDLQTTGNFLAAQFAGISGLSI